MAPAPLPRMGKERDLRERTMAFALAVLRFCRSMPETPRGPPRPWSAAASRNECRVQLPRRLPRQVASRFHREAGNRHRGSRRIRLLAGTDRAGSDAERRGRQIATNRSRRTDCDLHPIPKNSQSASLTLCPLRSFVPRLPTSSLSSVNSKFRIHFSIQHSAFSIMSAALAAACAASFLLFPSARATGSPLTSTSTSKRRRCAGPTSAASR